VRGQNGITLPELLAVLGVLSVCLALSIPAFNDLVLDDRMAAATNALVRSLRLGWEQAQHRLGEVVLCGSPDGRRCNDSGEWPGGWLVFANLDRVAPPQVDPGEPVIDVARRDGAITVRSNRSAYVLRPVPYRSTNGTIVLCDRRGPSKARAVIVSYTGRPRVSSRDPQGHSLVCPP
jgi:type IV fimbrial biogenesis protein FimT